MEQTKKRNAVICFTRVPDAQTGKTRLRPVLTGAQCAELQEAFLRDLADVYAAVDADLFVTYAPGPCSIKLLQEIFPQAEAIFPQEGDDLGQRMHTALCRVLQQGYNACLLTGSDLPQMTCVHLKGAFAALEHADVTLGPTSDGGYYLVGMKKPCPEVFDKQQYSCSTVFESAVAAACRTGYTVAEAPECDDVDTPEDLRQLHTALMGRDTHTARWITALAKEGRIL